jgi:hypothetical protein
MPAIPDEYFQDVNLLAADADLVARSKRETRRTYLGMSSIGKPCERSLWYDYHQPSPTNFDALTLKRFEDGHRSEDLMAMRLQRTPGVQLWTVDPDTGKQFECIDFDGRFKGHLDGVIMGLIQAPDVPHIWEGKCTNEKKFADLKKLKVTLGEKNALRAWDGVYYAQAQAYMGYFELNRHYLTVCTPGGRDWDACRTNFDEQEFIKIKDKAKRILESRTPLARISNDPSWWQCRFCDHNSKCHGEK